MIDENSASAKEEETLRSTDDVVLDSEQVKALDLVQSGENVFITGSGGTGKTVLVKKIVDWCVKQKIHFAVVTPTGVTAYNLGKEVGAFTYHSFFGLGCNPLWY